MSTQLHPHALLQLAQEAAQHAGTLIRDNVNRVKHVEYKSTIDPVTSVDRQSEQLIVRLIQERYPDHSIVAEEETAISHNDAPYQWIVDPLDGTMNFIHGYPHFAVSIAVAHTDEMVVGLVYDPMKDETFTATRGDGAYLNGESITTSKVSELDKAILVTGFPYDCRQRPDAYLELFRSFMCAAQGIRRTGSAALDLCYVASGRFDGLWEQKLHPWDVAAGCLIAEEAGGKITSFRGKSFDVWGNEILCSNGLIHDEMVTLIGRR